LVSGFDLIPIDKNNLNIAVKVVYTASDWNQVYGDYVINPSSTGYNFLNRTPNSPGKYNVELKIMFDGQLKGIVLSFIVHPVKLSIYAINIYNLSSGFNTIAG
jgi:hypothetical protein